MALLGVDEGGGLGGVSEEQDGRAVVDPVTVTPVGVELEGEAAGVAGRVGRALVAADGGEAGDAPGLVAYLAEHVDGSDVADVMGVTSKTP